MENSTKDGTQAASELLPVVYEELRKLAAARLTAETGTQTFQPTALVHEAWLRLAAAEKPAWKNRAHFFSAAAEAMRRILIDRARRKQALKRGVRPSRLDLEQLDIAAKADDDTLLAVNEALEKLTARDPDSAELVKLRFFVGLDYAEAAKVLGISERTAKRQWTFARAWLYKELASR